MNYLIRVHPPMTNGIDARLTTLGAGKLKDGRWLLVSDRTQSLVEKDLMQSMPDSVVLEEIHDPKEFDRLKQELVNGAESLRKRF